MRRRLVPATVALGLTVLAAPSCKVSVGNTSDPATGSNPVAKPPQGKSSDGKPTRTNPSSQAAQASVWGHFVVAHPDKTIERAAEHLAPPMFAPMVTVGQFKSMLGMQFQGRPDVVKHIDLSKPFGCVMVNPKQHDEPVACAIGYDGGLVQLVEDLGQEGYLSGGAGYASYEIGNDTFYLRAFDGHVGVALDPSLLAATEDALKTSVLKPGNADRDVFVAARPSVIFKDARKEIEEFYSEMERNMSQMPSAQLGADYAQNMAKAGIEMYRTFGDLETAEGVFKIGKNRTRMAYRASAAKGTPTAKQYKRDAKLAAVDVSLIEALPDDSFFVAGMNFDFAGVMDDPWMGTYFRAMKGLKAADGTDLGELMERMMKKMGKVMEGPVCAAAFPSKGSAGVMAGVYAVKPGKDAMAIVRDYASKYALEKMMPAYGEYVKSTYKKNAFTVGGVKADTMTITPAPKIMSELKKDSDYKKMAKAMGKVQMVMAMAQKGDRYYLVITTAKAKAALGKLMSAGAGKGSLGKFGGARKRVAKHSDGNLLMMVDVAGMFGWLRGLGLDDEFSQLPKLGAGLDDAVWTGRMKKNGKKEYDFSMSQAFIDQLRSL